MYVEISALDQIKKAQDSLVSSLKKNLRVKRDRVIGWPAGSFEGTVWFAKESGEGVQWWYYGLDSKRKVWICFVGRGDPQSTATLDIDLQFNFASNRFTRNFGGAFARNLETGEVFLCHRGIVTRGKSRVPRDLLLGHLSERQVDAMREDGKCTVPLFVVAPLRQSPAVARLISDFAGKVRIAATAAMESHARQPKVKPSGAPGKPNPKAKGATTKYKSLFDSKLGSYFDEFVGKSRVPPSKESVRDCRHGAVVLALHQKFAESYEVLKSAKVDLAVRTGGGITIYEVKTSNRPQAIYTAIGQLSIYGGAAKRQYPGAKIKRVLVMPDVPKSHAREFERELGISIMGYTDDGEKIAFSNH